MLASVGIVAHTSRTAQAKQLGRTVRSDFISIDNGLMGCDENHYTVQKHLSALPATWSIVLEDDAIPVDDFRHQAEQALVMAPTPIVSFYLGKRRPPHWQNRVCNAVAQAANDDASWIISTHLLHAVGYAIKTELLPSLLDHTSDRPSDEHITSWARRFGYLTSYTFGSLVDHADLPTIVDHPDGQPRGPGRKAWYAGTREHWTTKAVTLR
jgi:GR25 family glycosyltransferase involved in LPS biosynthesis